MEHCHKILGDTTQITCGKHLSPPLGLPTVSLSSSPDWAVVTSKSAKSIAKVKISNHFVQDARKVLSPPQSEDLVSCHILRILMNLRQWIIA